MNAVYLLRGNSHLQIAKALGLMFMGRGGRGRGVVPRRGCGRGVVGRGESGRGVVASSRGGRDVPGGGRRRLVVLSLHDMLLSHPSPRQLRHSVCRTRYPVMKENYRIHYTA